MNVSTLLIVGNEALYATSRQGTPLRRTVVRPVGLHQARSLRGTADLYADWRDRLDERQELRTIVPVRFGENRAHQ